MTEILAIFVMLNVGELSGNREDVVMRGIEELVDGEGWE